MTPEVRGSNPDIVKIYIEHLFPVNCVEKEKNKEKDAGNGQFKQKDILLFESDRKRFENSMKKKKGNLSLQKMTRI